MKRLALRRRDGTASKIFEQFQLSAANIHERCQPARSSLFRFYSPYGRRARGQKACFTKQEIRTDERPFQREKEEGAEGAGGDGGGGRRVENEPKER